MRYFSEIQRLPSWMYVLIASSLFSVIAILGGLYLKATSVAEKRELLIGLSIVLLTEAMTLLLLRSIKQEVIIDRKGIYYRYPPFKNKKVFIESSKIRNYDCINYTAMQYGYKVGRFALFVKTPTISMAGIKKAIKLGFNDGTELIIGTQKPEEFISILNTITNKPL